MIEKYVVLALELQFLQSITPWLGMGLCAIFSITLLFLSRGLKDEHWIPAITGLFAFMSLMFLEPVVNLRLGGLYLPGMIGCLAYGTRYLRNPVVESRPNGATVYVLLVAVFLCAVFSLTSLVWSRIPSTLVLIWFLNIFRRAWKKNAGQVTLLGLEKKLPSFLSDALLTFLVSVFLLHALNPYIGSHFFNSITEVELHHQLLRSLDYSSQASLLPLVLIMFFGVLYLILGCMAVVSPHAESLSEFEKGACEYLDEEGNGGILKMLGKSAHARFVSLAVRFPGKDELSEWRWYDDPKTKRDQGERLPVAVPNSEKSSTTKVMRSGKPDYQRVIKPGIDYVDVIDEMKSFMVLPIKYQGATIAALNFEWDTENGFSATAARKLQSHADMLAPFIHSLRQTRAVYEFSKKIEVDDSIRIENFMAAILERARKTVESNLACLQWFCGFRTYVSDDAFKETFEKQYLIPIYASHIDSKVGKYIKHIMGNLVLVTKEAEINGPALSFLATDERMRNQMATVLKYHVEENFHICFTKQLERLRSDLQQLELNVINLEQLVNKHVQTVGIAWAAIDHPLHDKKVVNDLVDSPSTNEIVSGYRLPTVKQGAGYTIRLKLRSDGYLILGIPNANFSWERSSVSPWKSYLDGLQSTVDQSLQQIIQVQLSGINDRLELESIRSLAMHLCFHEIGNITGSLNAQSRRLDQLLANGETAGLSEANQGIQQIIKDFQELSRTVLRPLGVDRHENYTNIADLFKDVENNFGPAFATKEISFDIDHNFNATLKVPVVVVYLAIKNVVFNAFQKLSISDQDEKIIKIEFTDLDNTVVIRVIDNGSPISAEDISKLFQSGFTTKIEGNGFGLFGSKAALNKYKGNLEYLPSDIGVCFQLTMPKVIGGES